MPCNGCSAFDVCSGWKSRPDASKTAFRYNVTALQAKTAWSYREKNIKKFFSLARKA